MYKVKCVKCRRDYEDSEPDDFYCPTCDEERKRIAAEIDKKLVGRPREPHLTFEERMAALPKIPGTNIPYIQ